MLAQSQGIPVQEAYRYLQGQSGQGYPGAMQGYPGSQGYPNPHLNPMHPSMAMHQQGVQINGMYGGTRSDDAAMYYRPNPQSVYQPYANGFPVTGTGRIRMPNNGEIEGSIAAYCGLAGTGVPPTIVRLSDRPDVLRHVCLDKPYYRELSTNFVDFSIDPSNKSILVWFYAHTGGSCRRLYIYKESS